MATRTQLNHSIEAYQISELGCISDRTQRCGWALGFIYSFLALRNFSNSLFILAKKKNLGKQAKRKEELERTQRKKTHYSRKTAYHLSSSLSFLSQDAAALIPILVSLTTLYPQQPQCLEPTIVSVPVFSIVLWYPHSSLHQPFYYYLPSSFDLGALFQRPFQFRCCFILFYCPGYQRLLRTWREEAVLTSGNEGKQEQGR